MRFRFATTIDQSACFPGESIYAGLGRCTAITFAGRRDPGYLAANSLSYQGNDSNNSRNHCSGNCYANELDRPPTPCFDCGDQSGQYSNSKRKECGTPYSPARLRVTRSNGSGYENDYNQIANENNNFHASFPKGRTKSSLGALTNERDFPVPRLRRKPQTATSAMMRFRDHIKTTKGEVHGYCHRRYRSRQEHIRRAWC